MQKIELNPKNVYELTETLLEIQAKFACALLQETVGRWNFPIEKVAALQNKHIMNFASLLFNDPEDLNNTNLQSQVINNCGVYAFSRGEGHKGFKDEITEAEFVKVGVTDFAMCMAETGIEDEIGEWASDYLLMGLSHALVNEVAAFFEDPETAVDNVVKVITQSEKEICGLMTKRDCQK